MVLEKFLRGFHRSELFGFPMRQMSRRYGTNIYARSDEWDILLILDAAQYGIVKDIADDYEYITNLDRIQSRASNSSEWAHNTFIRDYDAYQEDISDTKYVTDNVIAYLVLSGISEKEMYKTEFEKDWLIDKVDEIDSTDIQNVGDVYPVFLQELDSDSKFRPPDLVTSKCINLVTEENATDNIVCHYMMPHEPFVEGIGTEAGEWPNTIEGRSMINMEDEYYEELLENYRMNHKYILDHLRELLYQIPNDVDVVITADHGNSTGRFMGIPYALGHPQYLVRPKDLRAVPWVTVDQTKVTEPTDTDVSDKIGGSTEDLNSDVVSERLENLGYK